MNLINKDVMIDLETLSTRKNAVILQFGGVYFDRYTGELGPEIELNVDACSSQEAGLSIDASTIYWWLRQSDKARESVTEKDRYYINDALVLIYNFLIPAKNIWCHANFDLPILSSNFRVTKITEPYSYRDVRDIRTLMDLADIPYDLADAEGVKHTALDDCKSQLKYCIPAFRKLAGLPASSST